MDSLKEGDSRSSNLGESTSKKRKGGVSGVEETLDRVSQLPDALLVQILSLLPTKDAVASCVLSKRWCYLWYSIYNFLFINSDYRTENFIYFVDHVLAHCTSSNIKKFQLNFDYMTRWNFDLETIRWISFAVERKVEDVILCSDDEELTYKLPLSMGTCSSLITLNLSRWVFDKRLAIAWNSLKSLKLDLISLDDDDIVNLLSGCPAMETLELFFFRGFRRLEITSSNLKRLTLAGHWRPDFENDTSLEIMAPYLQHLEISGNLYNLMCRLVNVSSLVNAKLTFNITCIKSIQSGEYDNDVEEATCGDYHQVLRTLVQDYLHKLSYATELSIGTCFREVLCASQFEGVPWVLIPDLKCKYLTLELHIGNFNLHGLAGLLRASPNAETLNIDIAITLFGSPCRFESKYLGKVDNANIERRISSFPFPNLKIVKIGISVEMCLKYNFAWQFKKLFELSKFLLKIATVLEKFIITSERRKCRRCSMNCESRLLSQLTEKLLRCARSSANPVFIFQE
ncbi:F-box/LRR-repeat protein At3g26922-like isoform X1 [Nicotiana tomentosiformis]|uniref:F-box/LRR-repeat protein At3g26922-like isoform X1 n=1 Tax=Nicotiana tomentosiformis TaxID=4098 RepID=UPI00051C60D0|nr:F-box/LRR-repeat protein At3g26922-like [Nicotiana tomentosiformis]